MQLNTTKVEQYRIKKGWTRERMAKFIGIPGSTYHYITKEANTAKLSTITKIATALKVNGKSLIID